MPLSESQRVMIWKIILEEFGPNIQNIAGVENIVSDTLSRWPSMPSGKYNTCTRKAQCCTNKSFTIGRVENNKDNFPPNLLIVQRKHQK